MVIIRTIRVKWHLVDVFVLLECSSALIGSCFFNSSGEPIGTILKGEVFIEELGNDSLSRKVGN